MSAHDDDSAHPSGTFAPEPPELARSGAPALRGGHSATRRRAFYGHVVNVVYAMGLSLWFGALLMTGAVAAIIFPTMRDLGVSLDRFAAFDPSQHWKIAAGAVMEKAFFALDLVQAVSLFLIAGLFLMQVTLFGHRLRAKANLLRALLIATLIGTTGYHVFVLAPRMNANLRQFWTLAESGATDETGRTAAMYQAAFDADHPRASTMLSTNALLVAGLVVVSAVALGRPSREQRGA